MCHPLGTYSIRPIQKLLNCQQRDDARRPGCYSRHSYPDGEQPKTALCLWVRKITWYLYTRWVHGRMKAKQRWFKVTREVCHEWFHNFRHHVRPLDWRIRHNHLASTLFDSLVPWRQRRIRPQITRLSQLGELRNGHVANLQELYYTRLVKKNGVI